jgi:hypothetical protein
MKFIEDKLEALDAYFAPKKESEKWLIIIGIAGLITYAAYEFLLPYTESMYKSADIALKKTEKSIAENRSYLNSITRNGDRDYVVKDYIRRIEMTKKQSEAVKNKISFIDMNLNKLSDMLFNQQNWAIFLNSITDKAKLQNINIDYIRNTYVDSNGSFGHVLEVGIGCRGTYKNIVKFMNELEQSVLVTDIYGTSLKMDANTSKIVADINISVWGINR